MIFDYDNSMLDNIMWNKYFKYYLIFYNQNKI